MNEAEVKRVPIKILGVKYQISCRADEEATLLESATLLDDRLTEMRENNQLSIEQASMMVALNLASDLLKSQKKQQESEEKIENRLNALLTRVNEQLGE